MSTTLSINKLENLLETVKLSPVEYFTIDNECVYIHAVSNVGDHILIYVNSNYPIPLNVIDSTEKVKSNSIHTLKELEIDDNGMLTESYLESSDVKDAARNDYDCTSSFSPEQKGDLQLDLEQTYTSKSVEMKKRDKKGTESKVMFKHLQRLKFIVENVKYKLALVSDELLFSIKSDNSFNTFLIKRKSSNIIETDSNSLNNQTQLMICLDLNTLYANLELLSDDLIKIRLSVIDNLTTIQKRNTTILARLLDKCKTVTKQASNAISGINLIDTLVQKSMDCLQKITVALKQAESMAPAKGNLASSGISGLHEDISNVHASSRAEAVISRLKETEKKAVNTLMYLKQLQGTLLVEMDKVSFDNSILVHSVINNIDKFEELISEHLN